MGKKSQDPAAADIKSLFTAANPFRRQSPPPPKVGLGLGLQALSLSEPTQNPNPKRTSPPDPNPSPNPKRKKTVNVSPKEEEEEEESPLKKRKKRKRDEVEAEYEKRKYGEQPEEEAASASASASVAVGGKRKAKDVDASETAALREEEEEGFDDEGKLLRTVFVGNLPLKSKKKAVAKEFEGFGEIESVRIRSVPLVDSKTPRKGAVIKGKVNEAVDRVHAYIVFKDEQSAKAALSHNMAQVGGNHIRVDMACPPRKKLKGEPPLYERKKTVFVGNLPFDVKDEELYQLFCGPSQSETSVEAVRVVRDPQTSLGKGIAYVLFKTREAANSICKKNDLKIRDRLLRVSHAKSDATPSKRKDSGPKREFPRKKFAATTSNEKPYGENDKPKAAAAAAASLSYQGLRSSKSGVIKKSRVQTNPVAQGSHGSKRAAGPEKKAREAKRPAVAARKAKLQKKRKLEGGGTPENTHRNKKIRRK